MSSSEDNVISRLQSSRAVAVIRGESRRAAVAVADALIEGGIEGIEITFTTPEAALVIEDLAECYGDRILLGAGTITSEVHMTQAVANGARFLVSPGFLPSLVEKMLNTGLTTLPGVLTPSEILAAKDLGVEVVKLFPGSLGGPDYLKALKGPFPDLSFVPTGGVSERNVREWIEAGAMAVGAGGALAPSRIEDELHRSEVVDRARNFMAAASASL